MSAFKSTNQVLAGESDNGDQDQGEGPGHGACDFHIRSYWEEPEDGCD